MASTEIVWLRLGTVVVVVVGGRVVVVVGARVVVVVVGGSVVVVVLVVGSDPVVTVDAPEPGLPVEPGWTVAPATLGDAVDPVDPVEPCFEPLEAADVVVFCPGFDVVPAVEPDADVVTVVASEPLIEALLADDSAPPEPDVSGDPFRVVGGDVRDVLTRAELHPEARATTATTDKHRCIRSTS